MVWVAYGAERLELQLPAAWEHRAVLPRETDPPDPAGLIDRVLEDSELGKLASGLEDALVVVPDISRPGPEPMLLPVLIDRLRAAGVTRVEALIGNGLHRPMSVPEIESRYGPAASRLSMRNHDAADPEHLLSLGQTASGVPAVVNRAVAQASLVLSTGIVEPHQYAGFSGGYKAVVIGVGGEATISATHAPTFLDQVGVGIGRLKGNPFQQVLAEVGQRVGHNFCLNYVLDGQERLLGLAAGSPGRTVNRLAGDFREYFFEPTEPGFEVAVVGTPDPKSANLYQATRSATYLAMLEPDFLRPGGTIILAAPCPEGTGEGTGEKRFYKALCSATDPAALGRELLSRPTKGGEQRAWMVARVMERHQLVLAGSQLPREVVEQAGLRWAGTVEDALKQEQERRPRARCLVLADPFRRLPSA